MHNALLVGGSNDWIVVTSYGVVAVSHGNKRAVYPAAPLIPSRIPFLLCCPSRIVSSPARIAVVESDSVLRSHSLGGPILRT